MLAIGGITFSDFAIPETTNPKPINTIRPRAERSSISNAVHIPLIKVNPKTKCPITIITDEPRS